MIYVTMVFSSHSVLGDVDPMAFLIIPLMAYAADGHYMLAIASSLSDLGKRFQTFLRSQPVIRGTPDTDRIASK